MEERKGKEKITGFIIIDRLGMMRDGGFYFLCLYDAM